MGQKLGQAWIKVDGAALESMPGAKIDIGGTERTAVIGGNAVLGFSGKPKQSIVECEIAVGKGTSLAAFRDMTDVTITFECDTGQTYVVRSAWQCNTPTATDGDGGKVPLKFEGPPAEEMGV